MVAYPPLASPSVLISCTLVSLNFITLSHAQAEEEAAQNALRERTLAEQRKKKEQEEKKRRESDAKKLAQEAVAFKKRGACICCVLCDLVCVLHC